MKAPYHFIKSNFIGSTLSNLLHQTTTLLVRGKKTKKYFCENSTMHLLQKHKIKNLKKMGKTKQKSMKTDQNMGEIEQKPIITFYLRITNKNGKPNQKKRWKTNKNT
jgi:hypothetical protein